MKKIGLYLTEYPYKGGSYQYNLIMIEAVASLPKDVFQSIIVYADDVWKDIAKRYNLPTKKIERSFIAKVFHRGWFSGGLPLNIWRKISYFIHPVAKELITQNCDLWIFPSQDVWSYQVPIPALVTIYDLMHRYEKRFPEVHTHTDRDKHYKQICKWAKGILVDSEVGKQQVVESYGINPQKINVLPFVPPKYIYNSNLPYGFDQRYQLPKKFIFYPTQFWKHKNHKNLLKALSMLRKRYPDINLVFVGAKKNGYESTLRLVQELELSKVVFFLGYVPDEDMPELYRRARAMVMPTFFGPTNIPPLEANALGCPVAVSNIYAMPEQLGAAALYFNPFSINEIAEAIERLWTDDLLCAELRERGLIQASKWDQSHFNKRLCQIIIDVLRLNLK